MKRNSLPAGIPAVVMGCLMVALLSGCLSLEYDRATNTGTATAYREFADRYPQSSLGQQSRSAASALEALETALDRDDVTLTLHWAQSGSALAMAAHLVEGQSTSDTSCTVDAEFDLVEAGADRAAALLVELAGKADLSDLPAGSTVTVRLYHGVKAGARATHSYARPVFARRVAVARLVDADDITSEAVKTAWQAPAYYENRIGTCTAGEETELVQNYPDHVSHPGPPRGPGWGPGPHGGGGVHVGIGVPLHH